MKKNSHSRHGNPACFVAGGNDSWLPAAADSRSNSTHTNSDSYTDTSANACSHASTYAAIRYNTSICDNWLGCN